MGNGNTSVADFYGGKSVFITGATGFVGKVRTGIKVAIQYNN